MAEKIWKEHDKKNELKTLFKTLFSPRMNVTVKRISTDCYDLELYYLSSEEIRALADFLSKRTG